ncbi:hypothetical protein GCM10023107_69100 [Actinoplanes octamycinicus]|nr:hypothetical protein Aoc01nite_26010 [Actinoplanes octamycinicus]
MTNHCHVIVDGGHGLSTEPHVVIDLSPARTGHCHAASGDTYGVPGEMPLVATTLTRPAAAAGRRRRQHKSSVAARCRRPRRSGMTAMAET